jgi:hypothetical protein
MPARSRYSPALGFILVTALLDCTAIGIIIPVLRPSLTGLEAEPGTRRLRAVS